MRPRSPKLSFWQGRILHELAFSIFMIGIFLLTPSLSDEDDEEENSQKFFVGNLADGTTNAVWAVFFCVLSGV